MLKVSGLNVSYGGIAALVDVPLEVGAGEFVAVVGPNGAGKTTLFKAISGVVAPAAGRIEFDGADLLAVPPAQRAHLGIAHVPEGRQVFKNMSVIENLEMGAEPARGRAEWKRNLDMILTMFPVLAERREQAAGTLSGGEQQMLAIGRGLAAAPRLLMLDEPSMGLAPAITDTIFEKIAQIHREAKLTILLVEQRVVEALHSCNRGYVLESGKLVLSGSPAELLADDRIKKAYLGM